MKHRVDRQLLEKLGQAIEEWESSPYYLQEDELFDLERFLQDNQALDVKRELESLYGTPLNQKFWTSFLAYHRLRKAREEVKAQDAMQEEKRRQYVEAAEAEKRAWQEVMREWLHQQRREQFRVIPGGRGGKVEGVEDEKA
ncbi:MAG: hypothetical protein HGA63_05830 [Syntrophobacteraceae bacterium]|nr:hypothetical protein [Syntrophobacteraceae bacterium]